MGTNSLLFFCASLLVAGSLALPVAQQKTSSTTASPAKDEQDLTASLEYEKYLKEVVEALESDPEFRKKLDNAMEEDIKTGRLALELEYVSHNVRTKLDEIKRREMERLRELANKEYELTNDIDRSRMKIGDHVHHDNEHTFEIEDLRRLILKTTADLAVADQKRREDFKQYEMEKEFEKQQKLNELDEDHKKKYEDELKKLKEKHNKHEKVHHPGNRAQLEEVWEKQDHMDGQDFNPQVFFKLHDLDGNGFWDEHELKALFVKELDKVYQQGAPEDDIRERAEEMERMREHVFKEWDTNRDGLISYQEFMMQTNREDFNKDPSWETVDNIPQYTHEEFLEFERRRQEEIQRLVAEGKLPPHPNMPHGYYPNGQPHPNPNQLPPHYQQQAQYHQQQMPHQQQQQQLHHPGSQQQQQQQYQAQPQHPQQYQQVPQQQQYQQVPQQEQYQQGPQQQQYQQQPQQQQYQPAPQQQYQQVPQQQVQQPQAVVQNQQPLQQQPVQQQPVQQQPAQQQPVQQQPVQQQPVQQQPVQQQPVQQQPAQQQPAQQQPVQQQPIQQPIANQQPQPVQPIRANAPNLNAIPSDSKQQHQQLGKHN